MGWANWMNASLDPYHAFMVESQRRSIQSMPPEQLRAVADSMAVKLGTTSHMLSQAMRRIAELELQHLLAKPCDMINQLQR